MTVSSPIFTTMLWIVQLSPIVVVMVCVCGGGGGMQHQNFQFSIGCSARTSTHTLCAEQSNNGSTKQGLLPDPIQQNSPTHPLGSKLDRYQSQSMRYVLVVEDARILVVLDQVDGQGRHLGDHDSAYRVGHAGVGLGQYEGYEMGRDGEYFHLGKALLGHPEIFD